jgi:hypothetical protein
MKTPMTSTSSRLPFAVLLLVAIGAAVFLLSRKPAAPVVIAVIDTGANVNDPSKLLQGWNFFDNNANISDQDGHGTRVTAIISKECPACKILPLKIAKHGAGVRAKELTAAFRYAIDHDARIINMSFGITEDSPDLRSAVSEAAEHGIVVITAAGIGISNPFRPTELSKVYPQAYPEALVIGIAEGSQPDPAQNFGNELDLSVPKTAEIGSSSFAVAMVSGITGKLSESHRYKPDAIRRILRGNARQLKNAADIARLGYGLLEPSSKLTLSAKDPDYRVYPQGKGFLVDFNSDEKIAAIDLEWRCPDGKKREGTTVKLLGDKGRAQIETGPSSDPACRLVSRLKFAAEDSKSHGRETSTEIKTH